MNERLPYSPCQQSFFRVVFGLYLTVHFVYLIPYGQEIFSAEGMIPSGNLNPSWGFFPNLFVLGDQPWVVTTVIVLLSALSLLFVFGVRHHRVIACVIWYGMACLYHRNVWIHNPSIAFIGWLLLCYGLIGYRKSSWTLTWIVLSVGYTLSGWDKVLTSPSWTNGEAIRLILESPLARPHAITSLIVAMPSRVIAVLTWSVLAVEAFFAPLALFRQTRKWSWLAMVLIHLGILITVDFPDLVLGMLVIHLFTLDRRWLVSRRSTVIPVVDLGGVRKRFADLILSEDVDSQLKPSMMSSSAARPVLLQENDRGYEKSEAVLRMFRHIGGIWTAALVLYAVPRPIRDRLYDGIVACERPDGCAAQM